MRFLTRVAACTLALTFTPVASFAQQPAAPLVSDTAPVKGRLLDITPETLAIMVKGQRVEIPMNTVRAIDVGGDGIGNGAAVGAGVAAGLVTLMCLSVDCGAGAAPAIVIYTGFGALMGAGVDAMNSRPTTVFRKERAAAAAGVRPSVAFKLRF